MHFTTREKVAKTFWFCDLFIYQRRCIYGNLKGCRVLSKVSYPLLATYVKRVPFAGNRR